MKDIKKLKDVEMFGCFKTAYDYSRNADKWYQRVSRQINEGKIEVTNSENIETELMDAETFVVLIDVFFDEGLNTHVMII